MVCMSTDLSTVVGLNGRLTLQGSWFVEDHLSTLKSHISAN